MQVSGYLHSHGKLAHLTRAEEVLDDEGRNSAGHHGRDVADEHAARHGQDQFLDQGTEEGKHAPQQPLLLLRCQLADMRTRLRCCLVSPEELSRTVKPDSDMRGNESVFGQHRAHLRLLRKQNRRR